MWPRTPARQRHLLHEAVHEVEQLRRLQHRRHRRCGRQVLARQQAQRSRAVSKTLLAGGETSTSDAPNAAMTAA